MKPDSVTVRADLLVSVVMPLQGDSGILADAVRETAAVLDAAYAHYEIVLVVPAQDEATVHAAERILGELPCIRMLTLTRAVGRAGAILAGLSTAIGDYVVTLIPETDPPERLTEMVDLCREMDGTVNGYIAGDRGEGAGRRLLKRVYHAFMRRCMGVRLLPGGTDYHVFSRRMVNALMSFREGALHLRLVTNATGYGSAALAYKSLSRSGRVRGRSFKEEVNEGIGMVVAHSTHPLRWAAWLGVAASALNLIYMMYAVAVYLFKKDVMPGWTTLSLQQGGMFFLICSILAVLAEYLGRLLEAVQGRPLYHAGEEKLSSVPMPDPDRRNIVEKSD